MQIQPVTSAKDALEGLEAARQSAPAERRSPQAEAPEAARAAQDEKGASPSKAERDDPASKTEYTTVTTHCNKHHRHTPACPHTVVTQPAPPTPSPSAGGAPGRVVDIEL